VKFASSMEVVVGERTPTKRALLLAEEANKVAANVTVTHATPHSPSEILTDSHSGEGSSSEPPSIMASVTNPSALNGILLAKPSLPTPSTPVSAGVTGGQLVHRVAPIYPNQARALRLQGAVNLSATVMEDGSVRDVKVVDGVPLLAESAMEAVKSWRYKPYELDGKPVRTELRIRVDFKFPSDAASR